MSRHRIMQTTPRRCFSKLPILHRCNASSISVIVEKTQHCNLYRICFVWTDREGATGSKETRQGMSDRVITVAQRGGCKFGYFERARLLEND